MASIVEFILNAENEIVEVGHAWDTFALENGAPELAGSLIIGKPLLNYVSGNVSKQYVLALLSIARSQNDAVELDYRCDSPQQRRYMRMQVCRLDFNRVQFIHTELRTEPRSSPVSIIRAGFRERHTKIRCSMCNLLLIATSWLEPENAPDIETQPEIRVTYGICPDCQVKLGAAVASRSLQVA